MRENRENREREELRERDKLRKRKERRREWERGMRRYRDDAFLFLFTAIQR